MSREGLAEWRADLSALPPEDITDAVAYALAAPAGVNVAEMIVLPTRQG
jgi:NADP-dependent 3-hydroxy acid dehydrogenase YdfG